MCPQVPFLVDQLTHAGRDLLGEPAQVVGAAALDHQHEPADAFGQRQFGELLDPHLRRAAQELQPLPAKEPAMLYSRRTAAGDAAGLLGRLVDDPVHPGQLLRRRVRARRQPAVGRPAGQREHPLLVGAEPDPDGVHGERAGCAPFSE